MLASTWQCSVWSKDSSCKTGIQKSRGLWKWVVFTQTAGQDWRTTFWFSQGLPGDGLGPCLGAGQWWPVGGWLFGLPPVNSDWLGEAGAGPGPGDLSPARWPVAWTCCGSSPECVCCHKLRKGLFSWFSNVISLPRAGCSLPAFCGLWLWLYPGSCPMRIKTMLRWFPSLLEGKKRKGQKGFLMKSECYSTLHSTWFSQLEESALPRSVPGK